MTKIICRHHPFPFPKVQIYFYSEAFLISVNIHQRNFSDARNKILMRKISEISQVVKWKRWRRGIKDILGMINLIYESSACNILYHF